MAFKNNYKSKNLEAKSHWKAKKASAMLATLLTLTQQRTYSFQIKALVFISSHRNFPILLLLLFLTFLLRDKIILIKHRAILKTGLLGYTVVGVIPVGIAWYWLCSVPWKPQRMKIWRHIGSDNCWNCNIHLYCMTVKPQQLSSRYEFSTFLTEKNKRTWGREWVTINIHWL